MSPTEDSKNESKNESKNRQKCSIGVSFLFRDIYLYSFFTPRQIFLVADNEYSRSE